MKIVPFVSTSCFSMTCADTETGIPVTRCASARSIISQEDADKKAAAAAQQTAYAALQCLPFPPPETPVYLSLPLSGARVCTTCAGSSSTEVSVPAGAYFSYVSQEAADAAAAAELARRMDAINCPPLYFNTEQTYVAYCPSGTSGIPNSATAAAGTYCSEVSVEAANAAALATAKFYAELGLFCSNEYYNVATTVTLTCAADSPDPAKLKGPSVSAHVPAGVYKSFVSQANANAMATAAAQAQAAAQLVCYTYGNVSTTSNGGATPDCASVYGSGFMGDAGVAITVAADLYFSDASQAAANSAALAAANAQYAASLNCQYVE